MCRTSAADERKHRLSRSRASMTSSGSGVCCCFQRSAKLVSSYLPRMLFDWNSCALANSFTTVGLETCMMENTWDYLWPSNASRCMEETAIRFSRYFLSTSHMSTAQRSVLAQRLCREIIGWKHLSHPNILPLLGVSVPANARSFHILTEWMPNGNVTQYTKSNPNANRLRLVRSLAIFPCFLLIFQRPLAL